MNSNDQGNIFVGVVFIYTSLAVIIFAIIMFLVIGRFFDSQGVLLGVMLYLLFPLCLILAPLIGSILIVRQTRDLSIGFRSIIYSFLPLLLINLALFVPFLSLSNSPQDLFVDFSFFLLLAVLASLFASLFLLKSFSRIFIFSSVKAVVQQVQEQKDKAISQSLLMFGTIHR